MIDGFKFRIIDREIVEILLCNSQIDWKVKVSNQTGEMDSKKEALFKDLMLECHNDAVILIRGNLHKYYTGLKNYVNFHINDAIAALKLLEQELLIDLSKVLIINLEWGLNIELPEAISANRYIESAISYKGKTPNYKPYPGGGLMRSFELEQAHIKIYDKGVQVKKSSNLLRVEYVGKRKEFFKRLGIFKASDLFKTNCQQKLNAELLKAIDHIIFFDHEIMNQKLSRKDSILFNRFGNHLGWQNLIKNKPESYRKQKPSFRRRVTALSGIDWNKCLKNLIEKHSSELLCISHLKKYQEHEKF